MIEQIFRRAIIPGFESLLKRRKTFRYWRELEESQWWTRERLEQLQLERLQVLLNHCKENSTWYRETWMQHGIDESVLGSLDEIRKFPIMTREMVRDNAEAIRSADPKLKFISKSTGGSSGVPLQFVIEQEANDRRVAAAFRGYAWAGGAPGSKQSHLWGVPLSDISRFHRWKDCLYTRGLYRRDVLNSFELTDSNVSDYVKRLNRYRPKVLVAYTNPLYVLARLIEERGLEVHPPDSIIVGAEKLYDFQRDQIERAFGSPVYETYGSREFTLIAAECDQHSGLHLSMENLIVEIVDEHGNPTPPGEIGQIVVTDLYNIAMPFVRYAIGDQAVAGWEPCPCGRGLPLLRSVVGRQLDVLTTPDGHRLSGEFFPHLLKDYRAIRQFQVIQSKPDVIHLKLVVDSGWRTEFTDSVRREVQQRIGESTDFQIELVPSIALTAAGKRRVVIGYETRLAG